MPVASTATGRRSFPVSSPCRASRAPRDRESGGYNPPPRGCGGIGRRARFRSVWGQPRGGSSPLIRMARLGRPPSPPFELSCAFRTLLWAVRIRGRPVRRGAKLQLQAVGHEDLIRQCVGGVGLIREEIEDRRGRGGERRVRGSPGALPSL